MPSRNILKQYVSESYYHVYLRGASKTQIFQDKTDYEKFLSLFERYLSKDPKLSSNGIPYPHYYKQIELLAYCLMPTHFHLLIWQEDTKSIINFMRSLLTSYSRYYNLKYKRTGALFEGRYKASLISDDSYLVHISRYIHLNPRYWQNYKYSSLGYYFNSKDKPNYFKPAKIELMFNDRQEYIQFHKDYEDEKEMLDELKYELADN